MHPFLNLSQIYALLNIIGNFFFFYILGIMKKILFTIVLFALFAGLTGTFWVYHSIRKPSVNEKFVIVKIPQGASATKIGQILQKNGLISTEHCLLCGAL
jgi:cell division protein YceG involved in septum cleavage